MSLLFIYIAAALLVAVYYVAGPVLVYRRFKAATERDFFPFTTGEIESCTDDVFAERVAAVTGLGFVPVAHFHSPSGQSKIYTSVLFNYDTGEIANVTEISGLVEGPTPTPYRTHYVEFGTEYTDGYEINTNNCETLRVLEHPDKEIVALPGLNDVKKHYAVHRSLSADRLVKKPLPAPENVVRELHDSVSRTHQRFCDAGYFRLDASGDHYRPTVKGAIVMSYKLMWPMASIRKSRIRRRADQLIARV